MARDMFHLCPLAAMLSGQPFLLEVGRTCQPHQSERTFLANLCFPNIAAREFNNHSCSAGFVWLSNCTSLWYLVGEAFFYLSA